MTIRLLALLLMAVGALLFGCIAGPAVSPGPSPAARPPAGEGAGLRSDAAADRAQDVQPNTATATAVVAPRAGTPTAVTTELPFATATASATATPAATATAPKPPATASPTVAVRGTATPGSSVAKIAVIAEEVSRGDAGRPWVSLVFNAGAGYRPAPAILETLKQKGVRTTFFVMGWWADKQPELVRQIAAGGHEIASHGYEVFDLTAVPDAEVIADLERADAAIRGITGRSTKPLWSPSAGYRDGRVRRLAASLGYRPIYWTLDSGDWREEATAEGVRRRVTEGAANGSIIVMHFDSPRTADTVAVALPGIVDSLRGQGYRLVTISELIGGILSPVGTDSAGQQG